MLAGCSAPAAKQETKADEPAPLSVETTRVARQDVPVILSVDGSLVAPEGASSRLAPSVAGRLIEVRVKEGDRVLPGQLLARIDTRALVAASQSAAAGAAAAQATASQSDLALRAAQADQASAVRAARIALDIAIAEARSSVEQTSVELQRLRAGARPQEIAQAQQTVDQARIARDRARLDADRDARLLREGLVAGSQADASAAGVRTAESTVRSAQAALDLVRAGNRPEDVRASELRLASARQLAVKKVDQARTALRQAESGTLGIAAKGQEAAASRLNAQQKNADARVAADAVAAGELRSPIAGFVVKRLLNPGEVADATTPVLIVSESRTAADFVGNLSPEEASRVAPGMALLVGNDRGNVTSVGQPDPATGLVPIRAHLGSARMGGFATAEVVLSILRDAPVTPKGAIVSREGKDVVFVVEKGVAHQIEVTLGPERNGLVAVRNGLSSGQQVVVLGGAELSDGAKVKAAEGPDKGGEAE